MSHEKHQAEYGDQCACSYCREWREQKQQEKTNELIKKLTENVFDTLDEPNTPQFNALRNLVLSLLQDSCVRHELIKLIRIAGHS